ncbi:MAG: hypothetical protein ACPGXK_05535 [Phycisphaerae bacterium]
MNEISWKFLTTPLCLACIVTAGCHKAPKTLQESQLLASADDTEVLDAYWKRKSPPDLCNGNGRTIAIADFGVQFVTQKMKALGIDQPVVGIPIGAVGVAIWALGFERNNVIFPDATFEELPDALYGEFVTNLEERGFTVIPPESIRGTSAYAQFETTEMRESGGEYQLNLAATDTGRVKIFKVLGPSELPLIVKATDGAKTNDVLTSLGEELNADLVMRVFVRIGVYRGRATVEYDTRIEATTVETTGTLQAIKSVISEEEVIAENKWELIVGETETVDGEAYYNAIMDLFMPFIGSAFSCPDGTEAS